MGEDGNVRIFFYLQVFHVQNIGIIKVFNKIKTRLLEQYGNRQEIHQ